MNKVIKNTLILTAITLVAGLLLGAVYEITKEPIRQAAIKAANDACKQVVSNAETFEEYSEFDLEAGNNLLKDNGLSSEELEKVYVGTSDSGEVVGYAITTVTHNGFAGDIKLTVGISKDGECLGVSILTIGETAGLGMKAKEAEFLGQYANKKVEKFAYSKTGASQENEIDAISGATITTNAVTDAINAGLLYYNEVLGGK